MNNPDDSLNPVAAKPEVDFDFDGLVISGHGVRAEDFGVWQPDLVPLPKAEPHLPCENEHVLELKAHELLGALRALRSTLGDASDGGDISVELIGGPGASGWVTLETTCVAGSCRTSLATSPFGVQPAVAGAPLRFRANLKRLRELASIVQTSEIEVRLRLDRMRMTIVIDGRYVPVPIWPAYTAAPVKEELETAVDVDGYALTAAVSYLGLFAERDDVEERFNVVNFSSSRSVAGSRGAIGKVTCRSKVVLPEFSVPPDSLEVLCQLAPELQSGSISYSFSALTQTFTTDRLRVTLRKSSASFPAQAEAVLGLRTGTMMVPRVSLVRAVERLRSGSVGGVKIRLPGLSSEEKLLHLSVMTRDRDEWTDAVAGVHRNVDIAGARGWEGLVDVDRLLKVLKHFDSANVELSYSGEALIVSDQDAGGVFEMHGMFGRFDLSPALAVQTEEGTDTGPDAMLGKVAIGGRAARDGADQGQIDGAT